MATTNGRDVARTMWQRFADGDTDDALLQWMRERAAAIAHADEQPADARRDAIVRAAGLAYKVDRLAPLVEAIQRSNEFDLLDDRGQPRVPRRGEAMRILIATVRGMGLIDEDVSDPELRKRIERAMTREL